MNWSAIVRILVTLLQNEPQVAAEVESLWNLIAGHPATPAPQSAHAEVAKAVATAKATPA